MRRRHGSSAMRASVPFPLVALVSITILAACSQSHRSEPSISDLVVRRGDFVSQVLLTGELIARQSDELTVPRSPSWQVEIRWLVDDGAVVEAGAPIAILDSSSFTADLEDRRLKAAESRRRIEKIAAEGAAAEAEKAFAVEEKRAAVEKARARANVPADLLPPSEVEERKTALVEAVTELTKAEAELETRRVVGRSDLEVERLALARAERDISAAESVRAALELRAPRAGVVLLGRHPWEERKLREGDTVWVGMTVASLPRLDSLAVDASLPDVDDGRIAPGMVASCVLDALPRDSYPCRIAEIAPVAAETAAGAALRRFFRVRVDLGDHDPSRLRPGMSVRITVDSEKRTNVLLAPRAGLDLAGPKPSARLVDGRAIDVRLGPCGPLDCVVEQGLDEGARLRLKPTSSRGERS